MNKKTQYTYTNGGITIINMVTGIPQFFESESKNFKFILQNLDNDDVLFDIITKGVDSYIKDNNKKDKLDIENKCAHISGHKVKNYLIDKWVEAKKIGGNVKPFELFIENLSLNPSSSSIKELIDFLYWGGFPITEDGCFLAYKGIKQDYYSVMGNTDTIVLKGETNSKGQILNTTGSKIVIERSSCDDNRLMGCSFGIHVGTYEYASNWGSLLMLVKVNPKDVVSVPLDCSCQKLRCCAYEVVSVHKNDKIKSTFADVYKGVLVKKDSDQRIEQAIVSILEDYPNERTISVVLDLTNRYFDLKITKVQLLKVLENLGIDCNDEVIKN